MKRIIAAVLSLVMAISMAACSESAMSGVDSSAADSSSVADSSSSADSSSGTETTTTTMTTTTTTTTTTGETTSSTAAKGRDTTTTKDTAPPPASVGLDLNTVAKQTFGAKQVTYTGDPQKAFASSASADAGTFQLYADVKTSELFDPFDDIVDDQKHVAAVKADSQVFIEFQSFEYEYDGRKDSTIDGYVTAVNFNCKDEAEAKKLFPLVFTNEMKSQLITDKDVKKTYFGDDCAIAVMIDESGLNELIYAYYRIGNNVIGTAMCSIGDFEGAKPINYTKKFDYKADLDKLCKAFGAQKLPSSVK